MKFVLTVLWILVTSIAAASSPEESYLAARDGYIKALRHSDTDADLERHNAALADLETQLRAIIGPIAIEGFASDGKIHLDGLIAGDEGFGLIDGLVFAGADDKARLVVTTPTLFDKWLRAHRDWWPENPLPQDLNAALRDDDFYTQGLSADSAFVTYAEIPVARPAWATIAFAMLATRTQDLVGPVPDEINIFVRGADRVFIVTAKTTIRAGPIAACDALRKQLEQKAATARVASEAAGGKDEALNDKFDRLTREAERAQPSCFGTRARQQAFFPALVRQAQALIDALPTK